jgi:hypothetical protein
MHGDRRPENMAASEDWKGSVGGCVDGQAETFWRWEVLAVDGSDTEVDLLAVLVADDVGIGREGFDEAERGSAHDAAFDNVGGLDAKVAY